MSAPSERPLRRDAERNRRLALRAAEELFAERGLDVTLDDVARRAGLGVGTVYRRFAGKEELIEALFADKLTALAELAESAAADPDPGRGLAGFLTESCARQTADRGLRELVLGHRHAPARCAAVTDRLAPALRTLVARAHAAGALRADVTAEDLPVLLLMVGAAADFGHDADPQFWRRHLAVLLDGLAPARGGTRPLPRPPLSAEALDAAMNSFPPPRR